MIFVQGKNVVDDVWNPDGVNVELDSINFDKLTEKGPWFIV